LGEVAVDHYIPIADRLLSEGRFNGPDSRSDSKVPVGYPAVLAAVKRVSGKNFLIVTCLLQSIADVAVAFALYCAGWYLAIPRAGFWAGVAWLLYPPALALSTWVTAETFFTLLLTWAVVIFIRALPRRGALLMFCGGGLLGAATLFRGTSLLLPTAILPLLLCRGVPDSFRKVIALLMGMGCFILPWTARNYVVLHDPIGASVGIGSVFLQGSDPAYFTIQGKMENYAAAYANTARRGYLKPPEDALESLKDKYAMRVGLEHYRSRLERHPASYIPFGVHKALRMWYGTESGGRKQQMILAILSIFIVPAGLFQIVKWRSQRHTVTLLFGSIVTYFFLLHWITLPEYRYIYPIMPLVLLAATDAVVGAWRLESGSAQRQQTGVTADLSTGKIS
jgi:hypothetical protein